MTQALMMIVAALVGGLIVLILLVICLFRKISSRHEDEVREEVIHKAPRAPPAPRVIEQPTPDTARPPSPLETYHDTTRPDPSAHPGAALRHALESTDDILTATTERRRDQAPDREE